MKNVLLELKAILCFLTFYYRDEYIVKENKDVYDFIFVL